MSSQTFFNYIFVIFLELRLFSNEIDPNYTFENIITNNKKRLKAISRNTIFVNCKLFPYFKIKREVVRTKLEKQIRNGVNDEGIVVSVNVRVHMIGLWFSKPSDQRFSQQVLLTTIDVSRHRSITYVLSRNAICLHVIQKRIVFH